MISVLDVLVLSIGLVLFTLIAYFWKINVVSYLRMMIVVDIMIIVPMILSVIDLDPFTTTLTLVVVELGGILLLGVQYNSQIGRPYRKMYSGMVRARDNKDLNIDSTRDINITGEMLRLQSKQIEFVDEINTLIRSIKMQQSSIDDYLDRLNVQAEKMDEEMTQITDDVDQILQNAAVISEQIEEIRTRGIEFIDKTNSDFNVLVEVSQASNRVTDQINIIAVNAAIEAAQTNTTDTNFAVVADGIQSIGQRSRVTTERLNNEILTLRRRNITEVEEINEKLTNLEDTILTLGELANRSSSFTHQQKSFVQEIEELTKEAKSKNEELRKLTKVYQVE